MPGMTLTEKILAKHSGKTHVTPGENVWVNVDILMTHDVCGPGTIGIFHEKFGRNAKVWDRDRVVIIPDHYIFTADEKCHRNVQTLRDFVREQGLAGVELLDKAAGNVAAARAGRLYGKARLGQGWLLSRGAFVGDP